MSRFHVVALDTVGDVGRSVASTKAPTSGEDFADWVCEILDDLGIVRAHLVGHSYGGWIAASTALHRPSRISRLVLLSPAATFVPLRLQFYFRALSAILLPIPPLSNAFLDWLVEDSTAYGNEIHAQQRSALGLSRQVSRLPMPTVFRDDELAAIGARTLLLIGEKEPCFRTEPAIARARQLVSRVETSVIREAGHMLPIEKSREVACRIREFLEAPENDFHERAMPVNPSPILEET